MFRPSRLFRAVRGVRSDRANPAAASADPAASAVRPLGSVLSVLAIALCATAATGLIAAEASAALPEPKVSPLMTKPLGNLPGQEGLMLVVEYPPGGGDPVHRHDAHGFIYVLEGSIVMGVKGGKEVTLLPGQTFYEGPEDIHTVGRNASKTKPAKFVVFLVKKQGVDAVLPAQ